MTKKTESKEKESTKKAILNRDFRAAISYSLNRVDYLAQVSGKDGAENKVRNSLVPTNFVNSDGNRSSKICYRFNCCRYLVLKQRFKQKFQQLYQQRQRVVNTATPSQQMLSMPSVQHWLTARM